MAFKDFSAGDILTAQDVDNFLMRQSIMVFDDSSSRDSALAGFLTEGMHTFVKDTNSFEYYNGSSFEPVVDPILTEGNEGQLLVSDGVSGSVWVDNGNPGELLVSQGSSGITFQSTGEKGQNLISNGATGFTSENSISPLLLIGV